MNGGGFDVVIGNPPYVEYSKARGDYTVHNYQTLECGNIYMLVVERAISLLERGGFLGLIVPLSLLCTDRMEKGRRAIAGLTTWMPAFDIRPASLFEGVAQRLTIVIGANNKLQGCLIHAGGYRRWSAPERAALLPVTRFVTVAAATDRFTSVPKVSTDQEAHIPGLTHD